MPEPTLPLLLYAGDADAFAAEDYLATLIAHTDRARCRVGLWLPDRSAARALVLAAEQAGAQVEVFKDVHRAGLSWSGLRDAVSQLRSLRPSVVHFVLSGPWQCAEAIIAAALVRVPRRIVTFQAVAAPPRFGWLSDLVRRLSRRLQYSTLHHLVAVSSGNRETLERDFGVPPGRLLLIHNGVDTEMFQPARVSRALRDRWHIPPAAPVIGVAARLTHIGAQHVLLQAMALLWHLHPDTHVVLAGEGPAEQMLRAQANTLERPSQVHFVGQQSDMPAFFAQLDVCVLPFFAESLPFAMLEAMAMSLAVVVMANVGSSDAIEHERSGLLVPPGDDVALAHALARLLDDPDLRRRLGAAARRRVLETFSQQLMLKETHTLYGQSWR